MVTTQSVIVTREARDCDRRFIFELSPSLAGVAKLYWHKDTVVQKFQDDYIAQMLDKTDGNRVTFIAENKDDPLGFIHVCESKDSISGEECGAIPLLAVSSAARGTGVGKALMEAAENWAKNQGYRLLHLEVFHSNSHAHQFYQNLGFNDETIVMVKPLEA